MSRVKELDSRRQAYQTTFNSVTGEAVIKDLASFCGAAKTSFSRDPLEMAFREGRREVWLRIQQHLKLSDDDIWRLFEQEKQNDE